MRHRAGWMWMGFILLACVAYQWLIHVVIIDSPTTSMRVAFAALNGVPHVAINLFLIGVFGRTLIHGREPLITGFARRVHGTLPAYIEAYTRHITWAWCLFFASQVAISAVLFSVASLDTWSLFVNVLSCPLVLAMFVAEYLYRIARFPHYPHASIWKGVQVFVGRGRDARHTDASPRQ